MQDLPQHGSLSQIYLPRLIAALHRTGFEGTVRVNLAETTKVVYYRHGDIASAASNAESDRLANILIRDGRLTQAQLDLAKARVGAGGSLGKTLIELGFLSPTELLQGARRQVREILASCFTLRHGTFEVDPGPLPAEVTSLGLPTRRLIFDSVLQASERETVLREVGSMETVYKPDGDLGPALDVLRLDPEMDRVARSLDGSSSLGDLSGRTSLDDFSVSRIVLALEVLGLAERIGSPLPEPGALSGAAAPEPADASRLSPEDEAAIPMLGVAEEPIAVAIPVAVPAPAPAPGRRPAPRIEVTPKPRPAPEPPPIPAEELPAFATSTPDRPAPSIVDEASAGDAPQEAGHWQIDPDTGDRVRLGPVELTFDGEIAPPQRRTWLQPRALAGAAAALLGVALIAIFFALRRGDEAADRPAASRPATPAPAEIVRPPVVPTPAPDQAPPASTPAPPPPSVAVASPPPAATPVPVPEQPAVESVPARQATSAPPRRNAPPAQDRFGDSRGYRGALELVDAGDVAGAATRFQEILAGEPAGRVTLQLMVACVDETVKNAHARSGDGGALFFVPYSLKGRACYRVCWGVYDSRDAARAGFARVPEALRPAGASPLPVPLASLAPGH
jgi:hypothetical protein